MSEIAMHAVTVPASMCEQQPKQLSSSTGCLEGSFVSWRLESWTRTPDEFILPVGSGVTVAVSAWLLSRTVWPLHRFGEAECIAVKTMKSNAILRMSLCFVLKLVFKTDDIA
jgi:hypothetical protein